MAAFKKRSSLSDREAFSALKSSAKSELGRAYAEEGVLADKAKKQKLVSDTYRRKLLPWRNWLR